MDADVQRIIREELLRSIAWFGLAIVGWPVLADEVGWLETNVLTVFGLPVLTWAILTAGTVGIRVITARELQVQSLSGWALSLAVGAILSGVGAVYLVTAQGYDPLAVGAGLTTVAVGTILWYWYAWGRPYPEHLRG